MALACKCAAPTAAGRAKSHADLVKAFYTILGSGRRVRFTVKTAYRGDEDEDDTLDVWTPFGDCGYDFQTGETYLVYADGAEETGEVSTDSLRNQAPFRRRRRSGISLLLRKQWRRFGASRRLRDLERVASTGMPRTLRRRWRA